MYALLGLRRAYKPLEFVHQCEILNTAILGVGAERFPFPLSFGTVEGLPFTVIKALQSIK